MPKRARFATASEAEAVFYGSIEAGDLDMLMQVWADDDGIICIHPGGERLAGREAIRRSWAAILGNAATIRFVLTDEQITGDDDLVVHNLKENIELDDGTRGVMLATNIYRQVSGSWQLIMHHASPQPQQDEDEFVPPSGTLH
jgi:ketosteroid isomerase-like protein